MAYETYTTEVLVCGVSHRNTADGSFRLFTREAGMLWAEARSVREERSRQRYAVQTFSRSRVTLIRGKQSWKIGSVEPLINYYHSAPSKEARGSIVAIFRFLQRFVHGEHIDQELFDQVIKMLNILCQEITERPFVTLVFQVRLLVLLGYVDSKLIPVNLIEQSLDTVSTQKTLPETVDLMEKLYVNAVEMSQL